MKLKKKWKIVIILITIMIVLLTASLGFYHYQTSPVDKNDKTVVTFTIESGTSTVKIVRLLKENQLIRNEKFLLAYLKINNIDTLQASTYRLTRAMSLKEIVEIIRKGDGYNPNELRVIFPEGTNIREMATIISENTNHSYESVLEKVSDVDYFESLTEKYWFLDKNITQKKLYYILEGYLFPDTYVFSDKDASLEEIFQKMLDRMSTVLSKYEKEIENSKFSIHEILTLASMAEKEGKAKDFGNIVSVFTNRLNKNMVLGSCATAYYGMRMDFNEIGVANSAMIANNNPYNTYRLTSLPIGPISSVSENSLKAVLEPITTSYLYFLSDNEGNTYFFTNYEDHQEKQKELQAAGKWVR